MYNKRETVVCKEDVTVDIMLCFFFARGYGHVLGGNLNIVGVDRRKRDVRNGREF